MSLRNLVIFSVIMALCANVAFAEWVSMGERDQSELQVKVLKSTATETQLEITVPGFDIKHVKAGNGCIFVHIPGASWHMEKGFPLLPRLGQLVSINHSGNASLEVVSVEEEVFPIQAPVVPSKGHMTRDIDPSTVAFEFGPVYKEDTYYVGEQFSIGKEFVMRDVRGVRLEVLPVRVNHVRMEMKVIKKAVVSIKCNGGSTFAAQSVAAPSATFSEIYSNAFVNYSAPVGIRNFQSKRLIAVVPSVYSNTVTDWVEFKKSRGFEVEVKTIENESANDIKSMLKAEYDSKQFGYVVLFGDIDYMPTLKGDYEGAYSDPCYVMLKGDDYYTDAFISRISGNAEEITVQLNKLMKYETSGNKSGDWYKKGLTVASGEGSPKDHVRADWLINGGGKGQKVPTKGAGLKGIGFTSFANEYGWNASASGVADAVNNGIGIACYIGHGSAYKWVTSGFGVTHIKQLNNGDKLPVIWSVACVNGKFQVGECFAEAWLRHPNGGAAGVEAASTNEAWVPPCDKQSATVNAYIDGVDKTFGALEMAGRLAALKTWGDGRRDRGTQLAEQCNLFGDCSMEVHHPGKKSE